MMLSASASRPLRSVTPFNARLLSKFVWLMLFMLILMLFAPPVVPLGTLPRPLARGITIHGYPTCVLFVPLIPQLRSGNVYVAFHGIFVPITLHGQHTTTHLNLHAAPPTACAFHYAAPNANTRPTPPSEDICASFPHNTFPLLIPIFSFIHVCISLN